MLSWSNESLIEDGRSQSEIRQGVTLEVMGEGTSMGPLSERGNARRPSRGILGNTHIQYDIEWNTLGEYLEWLEKRGVSTNIASFVGTGTLRVIPSVTMTAHPPKPNWKPCADTGAAGDGKGRSACRRH